MRGVGRVAAVALASVLGCGPARIIDNSGTGTGSDPDDGGGSSSSSSSGGSSSSGSSSSSSSSGGGSSSGDTTTGGETTTWDEPKYDVGGWPPDIQCDVWAQDCPEHMKCMPWANDGTGVWNATKCVEVEPDPRAPWESCMVEGAAWFGMDNCDATSMCWHVNPYTLEGSCVPFCKGSPQNPMCDHPSAECHICNEGVLILCLHPHCDPLAQDCPDGQGCYPLAQSTRCTPDVSEPGMGALGDPCESMDACNPGLLCTNTELVPGCQGSIGCCAPYCHLFGPPTCNVGTGEECIPLWEEGFAPLCPNLEHVGSCSLPP